MTTADALQHAFPTHTHQRNALGHALRVIRGTRSLRSLAAEIGVSQAHLSRVESGERPATPDLVMRLASQLQVDAGPLLERTETLPESVVRDLSRAELRLAVGPAELPGQTLNALRRIHLAEVAERLLARVPGTARGPVDVRQLAAAVGWRVEPNHDSGEAVEFREGGRLAIAEPVGSLRYRFVVAHAVGHIAISAAEICNLEGASDHELDASTVAAFLLVPRAELRNFARNEARRHDVWDPDGAELIAAAAVNFGAPLWMVATRLGEDGRLAEAAGVDER